jgi:DNA-binding protein HU-beta
MRAERFSKKRMTQSEIIDHFAESTGMKTAQVKEVFQELFNLALREVQANREFTLPGFGKLVKSERKARRGRNPATGEIIQIPAKTTLKFRVGKEMKLKTVSDDTVTRPDYSRPSGEPVTPPDY